MRTEEAKRKLFNLLSDRKSPFQINPRDLSNNSMFIPIDFEEKDLVKIESDFIFQDIYECFGLLDEFRGWIVTGNWKTKQ